MTPWQLFKMFFKISSVTFGGGVVILGMAETEVRKRGDMAEQDLLDIVSLSAAMPGPLAVSSSFLIGKHYSGIPGAVMAVLGVLVPPFTIILLLSNLVLRYQNSPALKAFFLGVICAVAALLVNVVARQLKTILFSDLLNLIPYAVVIALMLFLNIHPLFAIAVGVAIQWFRKEKK
ncbi:MAG: chromate transporter [Aminobacterium sp.]|jgi:chromate transporter|uniref:Chromate transport protein n=1 Tax=bioreactor metagenome TaxID=1076179 RepID=A0A645HKL0_9ZZZZ|nr:MULTISPECIES: chromate transporter [unclassified Aminobacterium]MDD2206823.1 chromate transporter [Aminobacterium sp.]MDD3427192.1 chromate transporter [Aminobacterium sp.]MDD3708346.1 chromate transporter [Aminobacterium sp.]MDD4228531.1 chromate transporter [Aminobacterium sp.]MDD4551493.1 chromate transporter [Aminobacterium sp.]